MKKNKDIISNKAKEYYINNRELIRECARNKSLTEDEKQKMKDYQKQYRENMADEQKQKSRKYQKKYREAKKVG